jgi:hypothetical protein
MYSSSVTIDRYISRFPLPRTRLIGSITSWLQNGCSTQSTDLQIYRWNIIFAAHMTALLLVSLLHCALYYIQCFCFCFWFKPHFILTLNIYKLQTDNIGYGNQRNRLYQAISVHYDLTYIHLKWRWTVYTNVHGDIAGVHRGCCSFMFHTYMHHTTHLFLCMWWYNVSYLFAVQCSLQLLVHIRAHAIQHTTWPMPVVRYISYSRLDSSQCLNIEEFALACARTHTHTHTHTVIAFC